VEGATVNAYDLQDIRADIDASRAEACDCEVLAEHVLDPIARWLQDQDAKAEAYGSYVDWSRL
jgi:hypothetical protein